MGSVQAAQPVFDLGLTNKRLAAATGSSTSQHWGELVAAVVPGYDRAATPEQRAKKLGTFAVQLQQAVQGALLAEADDSRLLDACSDTELEELFAPPGARRQVSVWTAPVPLVLIDWDFAPFTSSPIPTEVDGGRLLWIRCANDIEFITSLAELGIIELTSHRGT